MYCRNNNSLVSSNNNNKANITNLSLKESYKLRLETTEVEGRLCWLSRLHRKSGAVNVLQMTWIINRVTIQYAIVNETSCNLAIYGRNCTTKCVTYCNNTACSTLYAGRWLFLRVQSYQSSRNVLRDLQRELSLNLHKGKRHQICGPYIHFLCMNNLHFLSMNNDPPTLAIIKLDESF